MDVKVEHLYIVTILGTGVTIIATHTVGSNSWNSGTRVTDDVFNNLKKWSE